MTKKSSNMQKISQVFLSRKTKFYEKIEEFFEKKLSSENNQKSKYFLAFILGSLTNLAFAPINFFVAIFLSVGGLFFLLQKSLEKEFSAKKTFALGFFFGFGYFFFGVYWIAISLLVDAQSFAWLIPFALLLIPAVLALYFGLMALIFRFIAQKISQRNLSYLAIIFAISWLICEILRSYLFSGFPWNLLGYVWLFDVGFAQSASIFGVYGLSFLAALFSAFVAIIFFKKRTFVDVRLSQIMLLAFVANIIFGKIALQNQAQQLPTKFRVVQANIKQEMKWRDDERYKNLLKHIELSTAKSAQGIAATLWSETSVPYPVNNNPELLNVLARAIPQNGYLITGGLKLEFTDARRDEISKIANSIFLLNEFSVVDDYEKSHLVPFGEYIPLKKYLPFVNKITDGAIDFSAGNGNKTIQANSFSFSPLVCYEIIFTNGIIDKNNVPDVLVNLTNDAWFGNSSGPYQHFDMSKMRAIEYGIPLLRVANSGISAFIDGNGRVIEKINLNQEGFFDVNLVEKLAPTIYQKYSYKALLALVLAIIILVKVIEIFYVKTKPRK